MSERRQAAVLVAETQWTDQPRVLLIKRAQHLRLHAGEIAFPGGMVEEGDTDLWHTALREAEEELELAPASIERLQQMPTVTTRTGIDVTPCLGRLSAEPELVVNREELDSYFYVPLDFLAEPANLVLDRFEYGGRERLVPRYEWEEHSIWGITAAILVKLVNMSCDAGLHLEDYWRGSTP